MSRQQANDLYWICSRIAALSLEMASNEEDFEFVNDEFDELYDYLARWMNDDQCVEGGLKFRHVDGRRISIGVCLMQDDVETL